MWQLVIDKCYKCACDWLTLKCLWPIVVETDAMSQIDIDDTCYVWDRSCNDGSHRERERVKATIEIDLKFIRTGGWSQKKEKDLLTVIVILTPWLGESSCRYWFQEWYYIREPEKYYVLIPVKGIETMTKTVMVNWAVMVFICRQSEPARPRACHSLRTAFTRRHTMWHHTLDAAFV